MPRRLVTPCRAHVLSSLPLTLRDSHHDLRSVLPAALSLHLFLPASCVRIVVLGRIFIGMASPMPYSLVLCGPHPRCVECTRLKRPVSRRTRPCALRLCRCGERHQWQMMSQLHGVSQSHAIYLMICIGLIALPGFSRI